MTSVFFRLNYPAQATLDQLVAGQDLAGLAPVLGMMLRPGHIVLAARYEPHSATGRVRAMGYVVSNGSRLTIDWRLTRLDVHPGPQGQPYWKKEHFRFAPAVARRYDLAGHAGKLFAR